MPNVESPSVSMPLNDGGRAAYREPFGSQPVNGPVPPEVALGPLSHGWFGWDLTSASFRKALFWLFLVGLLIRIGFLMEHARSPSFGVPTLDQKYYDTVARMLLAGEDLHELHGFRPLLYPMFLAVCYKIAGSWGVDLALIVQHLLGVLTGVIVAVLGARVFRHRLSGLVGCALFLLAPVPLYFEGELLIEPSYTFLICVGLLLHLNAAQARGGKGAWLWLLCGAVTVLAAQARANILVFLAVFPLFALWQWWRTRKMVALIPLLGVAGAILMLIPWGVVNMRQSDHFHLMPNAGGVAFYVGNKRGADGMLVGQDVIASLSQLSIDRKRDADENGERHQRIGSGERYQDLVEVWAREEYQLAMREQGRVPNTDPMAISRYWTERALAEIRAAPGAWLGLVAKKAWLTFWNAEIPNNKDFAFLQQEYAWLRLLPVRWVVLLMLVPTGLWAAVRWGNRDGLFIVLVYAMIYSAANVAFFVCDRYRYPVWPAMAVIAGGGATWALEVVRRRDWRRGAFGLLSMALMTVLSLHNWFGAKLPNFAQDYFFRSAAWYAKGSFPEALSDINRSVTLDPLRAEAQQHRGNVLYALNRFGEAKEAYEAAVKLMPGNSGVWNNLGATCDALGATNEALAAFHRATELTPPSRNAFLGMALVKIRTGLLREAELSLDKLQALAPPDDPSIMAARAALAKRRGDIAQAEAWERRARLVDAVTVDWVLGRLGGSKQ
jgi:tetratricopeptide (TPR) repeat protein